MLIQELCPYPKQSAFHFCGNIYKFSTGNMEFKASSLQP
jgi:hypothetical protein